jgi:conserved protein with predicted RNA binding PUA domain
MNDSNFTHKQWTKPQLDQWIYALFQYQYNVTFAEKFFEFFKAFSVQYSKNTGKVKHLLYDKQTIASYRPQTGTFTLSIETIKKILPTIPPPQFRVKVLSEVNTFIAQGKSVFCKHVVSVDPNLRPGDEVFVVDEQDQFLAIGKLQLPPNQVAQFQNGVAVKVRHSRDSDLQD